MKITMKGDDEMENELVQIDLEWMRTRTWYHWQKGKDEWVVHDLIAPVPAGIASRPITENDLVLAYPEIYVRDIRMQELTKKIFRYGDLPAGYILTPGRTVEEEPEPEPEKPPAPKVKVQDWFMAWMPSEFTADRARYDAAKNGYNPDEIGAIIGALMKKGIVYEMGKNVYRKV